MKRLRISFPEEGVSADAVLLTDAAPQTCAAIAEYLPFSGICHHGIYSGSEVVVLLDDVLRLDPENATSAVEQGDIAFTWMAAGSAYGVDKDFAEICWFYDRDAEPRMWGGPVPVSIFARFLEPADALYGVCRRMRREGIKRCRIELVDS